MASACSLLSEEQFLCSICLEVFTEPVSTPCGHNFCKACITKCWDNSDKCECPMCKKPFVNKPDLFVNTLVSEMVAQFRKSVDVKAASSNIQQQKPVKPVEVPCDFCPGTKLKALKSCLVCLASYCETHLEPHQRVATLKRHKLIDPVENLEDRMCKKHDKMLKLFCRTDQLCVCLMCTEHETHDTVPLEEEYEEIKAQLKWKKSKVQKMIQERQEKVEEMKASVQLNKKDTDEDVSPSLKTSSKRFDLCINVLGREGFSSGRFYFEVQMKGDDWDVGVVRKSISRKGNISYSPRDGYWIISQRRGNKCWVVDRTKVPLSLRQRPEKIGVFVDYDDGLVSLYDVRAGTLIYSFSGCSFTDKIYPFLSPGFFDPAPLTITLVKHR
uniref:Uncharacterized protein n=1 Tax=Myripristis murdjan TaxID=586833 RepID=A0A667Z2A3_9TELE